MTSPFERIPTPDAFPSPSSSPARRRSLQNIRSVDKPSRYRTDRVDHLASAYDTDEGLETSKRLSLAHPEPSIPFADPAMAEAELELEMELAKGYHDFLKTEQQRQEKELQHPGLTRERMEGVLRSKLAYNIQHRDRAVTGFGDPDKMSPEEARRQRTRAELMAAGQRESLRVTPQDIEAQRDRLNNLYLERDAEIYAPHARHQARLETAAAQQRANNALAQSRLDEAQERSRQTWKKTGFVSSQEADQRRFTDAALDSIRSRREASRWNAVAEEGRAPKNLKQSTEAVLGFAQAHNRPDFARRAEDILLGRQNYEDAPEITEVEDEDLEPMQVVTEDGPMRSARTPRVLEAYTPPQERRAAPSAFTDMLDAIDAQNGEKNRESFSERDRHFSPESMSTSLDLAEEKDSYAKQLVLEKQANAVQYAKQTAQTYKETIAELDHSVKEQADAFKSAFNVDIVDAIHGRLSLLQKAKLALQRWTSDGASSPVAMIDSYKRLNAGALEASARLQEKTTEVHDLEQELLRLQAPKNPNADHERAQTRAQRMSDTYRDRQSSREQSHGKVLGLRTGDSALSSEAYSAHPDKPSFEATKKNFMRAGFDEVEAAEAAEDLIVGPRVRVGEQEPAVSPAEAVQDRSLSALDQATKNFEHNGFGPEKARRMAADLLRGRAESLLEPVPTAYDTDQKYSLSGAESSARPSKKEALPFSAFRAAVELESSDSYGLGKSFSRLKNLTLKEAKKVIAESVRERYSDLSPTQMEMVTNKVYTAYQGMRESDPNGAWKTTQPTDFFYAMDRQGNPFKMNIE